MIEDAEFVVLETEDVVISACPQLIEESGSRRLWGYYLCVENLSNEKIRLVGKDWNITDDRGNHYFDNSAGFKGEIPELEPGEFFEFSSEAPLESDNAVFYGSCKIAKGSHIKEVKMPTFAMMANGSGEKAKLN